MSQRPTSPAPPDFTRPRSSSTDDGYTLRSSTPSTARAAVFPSRGAVLVNDVSGSNTAEHNTNAAPTSSGASRRLAFLSEKLSGQASKSSKNPLSNANEPLQASLLPPRSHSRADSRGEGSYNSGSTLVNAAPSASSKGHLSPSKATSGRSVYDSKHVQREMHRLAHLPTAIAPSIALAAGSSAAASVISLPVSGKTSGISMPTQGSGSDKDPWKQLHVLFLPLFNGEPLRYPIEDLNTLVKRHIASVVSGGPARAINTLETDCAELISAGMVTMTAKLANEKDETLVRRVVEVWGFFWDQVLPYVEGVLLPLQTDQLLQSLYRTPKSHTHGSGSNSKGGSMSGLGLTAAPQVDVRTVALRMFRDKIILPIYPRLHSKFTASKQEQENMFAETASHQQPRLRQMLLVLASQARTRFSSLSLTSPLPKPGPGEEAVSNLLKLVMHPPSSASSTSPLSSHPSFSYSYSKRASRAPSFLSSGKPRDRRGRVASKPHSLKVASLDIAGEEGDGEETPRGFVLSSDGEKSRRELLEALRSPTSAEPDSAPHNRASFGGWGLPAGEEDGEKKDDEEEYGETIGESMDWDAAQAVVEKMVGMNFGVGGT
ncbi:HbrB-domain-containing protein [Punctularia strigosozonata HHB-11173 SS5]|uniref:HbrB-domain-containing protein n=1 Tax=Punctularia strigosozonata (strain HHB-11173) TaxID=741275 RepID=UPI00044162A5|nr:HbrB-domain-containing protein [Punctularia strigosozonata HHB-11173 SS5]EIN11413.1 HbrB-domain-containing protein [Punctularia strigosozonata HHB-11173 SS5]